MCQLVNVGRGSQATLLREIHLLNVMSENYNTDYQEHWIYALSGGVTIEVCSAGVRSCGNKGKE